METKQEYCAPQVEILLVQVEKGFNASVAGGIDGWGEQGVIDDELEI